MKKITLRVAELLILTTFALTACGAAAPVETLSATNWKLVSYGPVSGQTLAVVDSNASIVFTQQGQLSGKAGCNGFSGDYKINAGKLTLGPVMSTLMACSDPLMTQESVFLGVLNGEVKYELEKDALRIYSADGQTLLTFARQ